MARHIDESKPLNASDRAWLTDWCKFDVIARIDEAQGVNKKSLKPAVAATVPVVEQPAPDEDADVPFTEEDEDESTGDGYADWTNEALRKELGNRELSKSGAKDELVARLEEDDADT